MFSNNAWNNPISGADGQPRRSVINAREEQALKRQPKIKLVSD
jgi:hypothetical protein